jgi:hypothetical protein
MIKPFLQRIPLKRGLQFQPGCKYFLLICLLFAPSLTMLQAQNEEMDKMQKEFEAYKKQENARFEAYREKENRAFASFLKQQWVTVPAQSAIQSKPTPPLPADIPLPEIQSGQKTVTAPISEPGPAPKEEVMPEPLPLPNPDPPASQTTGGDLTPTTSVVSIAFYGVPLALPCQENIKVSAAGITESQVSAYWNQMSEAAWLPSVRKIQEIAGKHQLSDWAVYLLVRKFSEAVHTQPNQQILFQCFFWNQLGFHARLARSGENLLLLLPSRHKLYGLPFTTLSGNRYFVVAGPVASAMQTFTRDFSRNNRPLDMEVRQVPTLGSKFHKKRLGTGKESFTSEVRYNLNWTSLLEDTPQTDLDLIFKAKVSSEVEEDFRKSIEPALSGKSDEEKVAWLLSFVQQSFAYQTDQDQFGREKYFLVEEVLHYPYSDCEDRAVLFAWLVKVFTGLKVVGLNYDAHVATAVHFKSPVKGDALDWKGSRFVVCDPTYIGAGIGMTMPSCRGQAFRVIETE